MSIEIGSKWVKDGKVIEIIDICNYDCGTGWISCVWFKDIKFAIHVITNSDLLVKYEPYEPVYEYQYTYILSDENDFIYISNFEFYKDDNEFKISKPLATKYQRIDFTKKEHKQ